MNLLLVMEWPKILDLTLEIVFKYRKAIADNFKKVFKALSEFCIVGILLTQPSDFKGRDTPIGIPINVSSTPKCL